MTIKSKIKIKKKKQKQGEMKEEERKSATKIVISGKFCWIKEKK